MYPGRTWKALVLVVVAALVGGCAPSVEQLQEDRDVAALVEILGSDTDVDVRADAATALGAIGATDALDALVTALGDGDASVRAAAAGALAVLREPATIAPLLAALDDGDAGVQANATEALGGIIERLEADGDVASLVTILESDAPADVRTAAADALGIVAGTSSVSALLGALDDPEPEVRTAAASALGRLEDPGTIQALFGLLGDADSSVLAAVGGSLERISREAAPSKVRPQLLAIFGAGSIDERIVAAELLGTSGIGDAEVLQVLLAGMDDAHSGVQAASADAAALVIEEVGTESDEVLIAALTAGAANARAFAAQALGASFLAAAVEPLIVALADEDARVRDAAGTSLTAVLANLPEQRAVRTLVEAIRALPDEPSQAAASRLEELLVEIGPYQAVEALATLDVSDRWLAIALGVSESEIAGALQAIGIRLDTVAEIEAVAAAVAGGQPAATSPAYDGSDAFHPAMFFVQEGTDLRRIDQVEWEPTAIRFLELVVVKDEMSWQQIEECLYNGPSIIRYRGTQTVRVLAARDGSLVASRTFQGTDPRACQPTESYWLTELFGEEPDTSGITEWLEAIIHPPTP